MSRFNHYSWALIPLLSIMSISPLHIQASQTNRAPANILEEKMESSYPKYEGRAAKVDLTALTIDQDITMAKFSDKAEALRTRLMKERKDFKQDLNQKDEVAKQQKTLNEMVMDLVIVEADYRRLNEKKIMEDKSISQELAFKSIRELKITLESLLIDVHENELLVLAEEISQKEKIEVASKVEPKKEEDIKKTDLEKRLCAVEDQNKALLTQVNEFVTDQRKIIDIMLSMQQQMQHQMQQSQAFTPYYAYPQVQQPIYMYQPQMAQQQFSLMPNSYTPQESLYRPMGFNPSAYTEYDPRYSVTPQVLPGAFGHEAFSFNFAGPTMSIF